MKRDDAVAWMVIFGLGTIAVALLFWMGAASRAGEPLAVVCGIASVFGMGVAASLAVRFSRRP